MSAFDDTVADFSGLLFEHSGDVATCREGGTGSPVTATVILVENGSREESRNGDRFRVRMGEIVVQVSEFVPVPADTITIGAGTWTVVNQSNRDAFAITVACELFTLLQLAADGYQEVG